MKKENTARSLIVFISIVGLYLILVLNLFYWQVMRGKELKAMGFDQSSSSIDVPAKRGDILTSDGFPLATNTISYLVYTNPKVIKDKKTYALKVSEILGLDEASISAKLNSNLFWVKIGEFVDPGQKDALSKLNLPGMGFEQQPLRFYPESSMAAQLVGFLGKNEKGSDHGYFGLEGFYNEQLKGRDGKIIAIRDALGTPILNDIREEKKIDGRTIQLTVDRSVQFIAERNLKKGVEQFDAVGASVVIMDSKTGGILAMATYPQFDPQKYWEFDQKTYKNPVVSSLYEPGSTFKTLVMSSAIDEGAVTPSTRCDICSGPVRIGEYEIETWNGKYFANTTMAEVIEHSDNTGMVFVGRKMGLDNLLSYFKKFGVGENTGIDLQGEVSAEIKDEKDWYSIDAATATFGQGISMTSIELITAVNSIANNGVMMKPYVVSKIVTNEGKEIEIAPKEIRRTIKESTAKVMTAIMVDAVEKGEAKFAKIEDYKIAGKTGTAQIPVAGHYDPNQTIASFVGFFPAGDPKITMLVIFDRPQNSIYGSETAAPIFFSIARDLIRYYNIPPSN